MWPGNAPSFQRVRRQARTCCPRVPIERAATRKLLQRTHVGNTQMPPSRTAESCVRYNTHARESGNVPLVTVSSRPSYIEAEHDECQSVLCSEDGAVIIHVIQVLRYSFNCTALTMSDRTWHNHSIVSSLKTWAVTHIRDKKNVAHLLMLALGVLLSDNVHDPTSWHKAKGHDSENHDEK